MQITRIDCRQISGVPHVEDEQVKLACDSFTKLGCIVLDHVVRQPRIADLEAEFGKRYHNYLQNCEFEDTLKVGNKRYMIPVDLSGGFADPEIYANPVIVAIARRLLGQDAILESFGAVVSLAGARQQHIHRDGMPLFDATISTILPPHAFTLAMPLIDMNESHGTTALWPGSHRWSKRDESVAPIAPEIPVGSCGLWDFRLYHNGTPNRSGRHRPILYSTFARRWYQDPSNFIKGAQRRLSYGADFLATVPEDRRSLFAQLD